ncbi:MAG: response regulator, partial [Flavobacteriales bacterium]
PDDKQEKIFESFNQGDQLKTRKFGGTGLGLSISKQIVELQGGVIWVESVEGEGSTFCFALPAMRAEGVAEEAGAADAAAEIGPIRILIAEDNPFNVIVTEDTLKTELPDVTIGKAENGKVAFEKVRDEDWDLVLMDIHMPEMSGLEATAAIRKLPDADKAKTLIVAMTASVLREETDNYMRHGMDGFVPKPFQADQLKNEISRLQRSRQQSGAPGRPALPPLRILIAEDNPFNVIVAEDTLRTELDNVTIGKAENGQIALDMVRDEEWDIVLMDIAMPEMTGIEATLAIRKLADAEKASTTIIAMTASVLKEDTDHYLKKGMDGFVPKPFKVDQLISEIEKAHLSKKK